MAEGSEVPAPLPPPSSLKGLREQMVAAAQALAEERRSQSTISPVPLPSPISTKAKPVIDGSMLKSEERQRLARERREERDKKYAARESQLLEKEKKAKLQYEKQVEEKQKRLREQKLKDQQRRAAVEEKRKQKIEEEREHYEAVMHRTLERSQRLETRQKRWSWGGSIADPDGKAANKRSISAANLKQADTLIHKRLSSSAALLNSPDKGSAKRSSSLNRLNNKSSVSSEQPKPKALVVEQKGETDKKRSSSLSRMSDKLPELENEQKEEKAGPARRLVSPLECHMISRLLTPTQASLARSKSAATLSAEGKDPLAVNTSSNFPAHVAKVPMRSRSSDRLKAGAASSENPPSESRQKPEAVKQPLSSAGRPAPSPALSAPRRPPSPGNVGKRPPSPSAISHRPHPVSQNILRQPPTPATVPKPAPIQRPSLTPNVLTLTKKRASQEATPKVRTEDATGQEQGAALHPEERETAAGPLKAKEDVSCRTVPGTTTAEEAARILAEKRRLAREQREREEQEKIQRKEEERTRREAEAQRALEEQVLVEAALWEQEQQQQRLAEEGRARRELEEQEKVAELQMQREEAEARAAEEAERQRQERERIMQQNLQERLERKKRIEEIMKRTRKADQNDTRNEDKSNEEDEGVEDEELGLEKQDQPEKAKHDDSSLEDDPEALHTFTSLQEDSQTEADLVFVVNGNEQEEVGQRNKDGDSVYFTQSVEARIPAKETLIGNSEILHVNEADNSAGFIPNLNGKSSAWNFEEILDLGVHPKTVRLSPESAAAGSQNFRDGVPLPARPRLAFEEESATNSLTKPLETSSEL